jgi:hypothetical protein
LIGEKFFNFLRAADRDTDFAREVPSFVDAIRRIFDQAELRAYLDSRSPSVLPTTTPTSASGTSRPSFCPRFDRWPAFFRITSAEPSWRRHRPAHAIWNEIEHQATGRIEHEPGGFDGEVARAVTRI